jgi:hypothetical protein
MSQTHPPALVDAGETNRLVIDVSSIERPVPRIIRISAPMPIIESRGDRDQMFWLTNQVHYL